MRKGGRVEIQEMRLFPKLSGGEWGKEKVFPEKGFFWLVFSFSLTVESQEIRKSKKTHRTFFSFLQIYLYVLPISTEI